MTLIVFGLFLWVLFNITFLMQSFLVDTAAIFFPIISLHVDFYLSNKCKRRFASSLSLLGIYSTFFVLWQSRWNSANIKIISSYFFLFCFLESTLTLSCHFFSEDMLVPICQTFFFFNRLYLLNLFSSLTWLKINACAMIFFPKSFKILLSKLSVMLTLSWKTIRVKFIGLL